MCLIFDETDGMGGGLAKLVDDTRVPVICICNERGRKLETLGKRSVDNKFVQPMPDAIAARLR
jgi:DNA polymerase III delta prime subunit